MLRRLTTELEFVALFQGEALQDVEAVQRRHQGGTDETEGSLQSLPEAPRWINLAYDGSVTPQESIACPPLMTTVSLSSPRAHDCKQFTIGITVHGPPGTPWDRSLLHMLCTASPDYPFSRPQFCFCTGDFEDPRLCRSTRALKAVPFHRNVDEDGRMNLAALGYDWNPSLTVPSLARICVTALTKQNDTSKCVTNPDADRLYRASKEQWEREARARIEEDWRVD